MRVKRVLLTGMSGTGKSSVLSLLRARGFKTVDTDYGGWTELVDVPGDPPSKDWLWREDRMTRLLSTEDAEVLFVSGAARNQTKFYPEFDHVVLLTAPVPAITERLTSRTNNPYGKDPAKALTAVDRPLRSGLSCSRVPPSTTQGLGSQCADHPLRRPC